MSGLPLGLNGVLAVSRYRKGRGGERFVVAGLQDDEAGTGGSFVPK